MNEWDGGSMLWCSWEVSSAQRNECLAFLVHVQRNTPAETQNVVDVHKTTQNGWWSNDHGVSFSKKWMGKHRLTTPPAQHVLLAKQPHNKIWSPCNRCRQKFLWQIYVTSMVLDTEKFRFRSFKYHASVSGDEKCGILNFITDVALYCPEITESPT